LQKCCEKDIPVSHVSCLLSPVITRQRHLVKISLLLKYPGLLAEVLTIGPLTGAGLDVFEQESLAAYSPLRILDNIILTPHIGWTVEEVFKEFAQIASTQQLVEAPVRLTTLARGELTRLLAVDDLKQF